MVTVTDFKTTQTEDGKTFHSLRVQGGIESMQSKTGRFYLTTRSCWVTTTFDEQMCKDLIGTNLPGRILKAACDPFEYTIKETGEVMTLEYEWRYDPLEDTAVTRSEVLIPQHMIMG